MTRHVIFSLFLPTSFCTITKVFLQYRGCYQKRSINDEQKVMRQTMEDIKYFVKLQTHQDKHLDKIK